MSDRGAARLVAFFLPQFHPTPENDDWWGPGFTEWTNVVRARPLFTGHYQPHLPAHLGFYDLRAPEVREKQAELARAHGIEAFCYWHYWFQGKRMLRRPFDEVLASGKPDFPFCLAWANETWSRTWLGQERDILLKQTYSEEDDVEHIRWLIRAFRDPRYLTVDGRPAFLVYRPGDLPDARSTTDRWRAECRLAGVPDPYLIGVISHHHRDWRDVGFDANLTFEPQLGVLPGPLDAGLKIYDYAMARRKMASWAREFDAHRCVVVSWDNSPRRGEEGIVFINATPEAFRAGLADAMAEVADRPFDERLIFLNAWNEWAEGNHLEPDRKNGLAYLTAIRDAVNGRTQLSPALSEAKL
jgi:lipopolysaccharide biosynthesis protein